MSPMLHQWARRLDRWRSSAGFSPDWFLIPLAALVGTLGGLVAAGFGTLVEHGGALLTSLPQGTSTLKVIALIIAVPALGGLIVGLIQYRITKSGAIHGVPEVIESLARDRGKLSGRTGVNKAVTATCTLATGGSAGIEGPIITVGSTLGSKVAQWLHLKPEHYPTLIGCGAASATAGIFNAPIAGVLFVLEVILRDFSVRTFMPIVVAAVFGTAVSQQALGFFGSESGDAYEAIFRVPPELLEQHSFAIIEAPAYLVLGLLCGMAGLGLAGSMRLSERAWSKSPLPNYTRPSMGGLLLGGIGALFFVMFSKSAGNTQLAGDHAMPPFMGNGYHIIEHLLTPETYIGGLGISLLLVIVLAKIVGTALTIGSGGSGGVIAPSLLVGAATGALTAIALQKLNIFPVASPATYALVGMAGVIAASLHCPLTAFILVFEITQDYKVILPVMLVSITATVCAQFLHRESIYTDLLRRRGIRFGQMADMTLLRRLLVSDVPISTAVFVMASDPAQKLIDLSQDYAVSDFVVVDENERYEGMVVGDDVRTTLVQREAVPLMIVAELMRSDLPTVLPGESLDLVLDKFATHEVSSLPVLGPEGEVTGMITRSRLLRHYQTQLEKRG